MNILAVITFVVSITIAIIIIINFTNGKNLLGYYLSSLSKTTCCNGKNEKEKVLKSYCPDYITLYFKKPHPGTSEVAKWLKIHLAMQGTLV